MGNKKSIMIYVKHPLLFIFILACTSCVLMEGAGRALDGSAFAEKTSALYKADAPMAADGDNSSLSEIQIAVVNDKNKESSIIILIKKFPMIKIRASVPDEEGIFHLTSLDYLAGSTHGWNEYSMQMSGTGLLKLGNSAVLEKIEEMEPIQITAGRIHRYDTRLTGSDAVTALRNRSDRITVLAEWMLSKNAPKGQDIKEFEKYWKSVFFPEMVSRKEKPEGWLQSGDEFQKAEDINWNTGYTERVFPEELHLVRNSGTLLRDWEEALLWIYFRYEWNNIKDIFTREIIFNKTK